MSDFSAAVRLTGLDDFIAPSQTCTKPVTSVRKPINTKKQKISLTDDGVYKEIDDSGQETVLQPAKITLNDCLACSGCVTSAETMLITQQSKEEFYSCLGKGNIVVVTISSQARASLAAQFGLKSQTTFQKLITFFKQLGANYVFDSNFSREFSLLESCEEFVARYQQKTNLPLPILSSSCPGWICYAEKTHGSYILPYISTAKSEQQVMGTLIKDYFAKNLGVDPSKIYHTTIMMCFDKKLEASRDDFSFGDTNTREVDCVLTSNEVLNMIIEKQVDFAALNESPVESLFTNINEHNQLIGVKGGSGGYMECVFRYAAKKLFGVDVEEINYKVKRNNDFKEAFLEVDGKVVLRFALAYGFRNIQNIVRKIKQIKGVNTTGYDYLEVMACPGGCINGGGQIRPSAADSAKELLKRVDEIYHSDLIQLPITKPHSLIPVLYDTWIKGGIYSDNARKLLHTQYHEREKMATTAAIQW